MQDLFNGLRPIWEGLRGFAMQMFRNMFINSRVMFKKMDRPQDSGWKRRWEVAYLWHVPFFMWNMQREISIGFTNWSKFCWHLTFNRTQWGYVGFDKDFSNWRLEENFSFGEFVERRESISGASLLQWAYFGGHVHISEPCINPAFEWGQVLLVWQKCQIWNFHQLEKPHPQPQWSSPDKFKSDFQAQAVRRGTLETIKFLKMWWGISHSGKYLILK